MTRITRAITAPSLRRLVWALPVLAVLGCGGNVAGPEPVDLVGTWGANAPGGTIMLQVWRVDGELEASVGMFNVDGSLTVGAKVELHGSLVRIDAGDVFQYTGGYRGGRMQGTVDLPLAEVSFPLEFRRL